MRGGTACLCYSWCEMNDRWDGAPTAAVVRADATEDNRRALRSVLSFIPLDIVCTMTL